MSRCFPFPPPGYERKTKANDSDFLKKEKHREKKHKKEKKDKEKKEGKEKCEKERSDEKHREKKDKKDKHRDKRKDKEKDRDKDKHKSDSFLPDEKRVVGPSGGHFLVPSEKSKEREGDRSATLAQKSVAGLSVFRNGEQISRNNLAPETKNFRYAPEFGWRSADEERRTINQSLNKNVDKKSKKNNEMSKLGGNTARPLVDGNERTKEKAALDGRINGGGVVGEVRSSGSVLVPNSVGMVQIRVGVGRPPMEKKAGQILEGKEKIRDKEGDDRKRERRKEKDREKSIHKVKVREKEKKKEEKVKLAIEQMHVEQSRIKDGSENHMMLKSSVKDGNKKEFPCAQNVGLQNIPKVSNPGAVVALNNLGKRKDIGLNGIYDEHSTGPNKLAKTGAPTYPLAENGRSLEPCQNSTALAPTDTTQRPPMNIKMDRTFAPDDTQRPPMNIKVDGKELKINGILPHQSTRNAQRKSDAAPSSISKPPHPDTKYLRQVLSVPKMDEWSDFDDQEWLFSSSSQTRKMEVEPCGTDKTPPQVMVWGEALWLEPVDVYALPYVIPR